MLAPFLVFASVATAKVLHSLPAVPEGWSFARSASPSDAISLKIALHQRSADNLERVVLEVSTPGHPNYGMHLTRDELRSYTAPSADAVDTVSAWLNGKGIAPSVDNDWVSFTTTVDRANALLNTRFDWYQYEDSNAPVLRTLAYSVPDDLTHHVDLVQPTTRFGKFSPRRSTVFDMKYLPEHEANSLAASVAAGSSNADAACGTSINPACLRSLYGVNYTVANPAENLVAFSSYLSEYARYNDLNLFTKNLFPAASGRNFSVTLVNKGLNDQNSNMDSGAYLSIADWG